MTVCSNIKLKKQQKKTQHKKKENNVFSSRNMEWLNQNKHIK